MSVYRRNYRVTLKDGTTETRRQEWYTIELAVPGRKYPLRVKGPRDKKSALARESDLRRKIERGEADLVDPFAEHKARALAEHLGEWAADLRASGRSGKYVDNCALRMRLLTTEAGWGALPDVSANGFLRWRREHGGRPRKGTRGGRTAVAATTLNQFLDTASAFMNWCKRNKRFPVNPLEDVARAEGEKVRRRRALSDDEVLKILQAAPSDRAIVYRFAWAVGLRRGELAALKWGDVQLSAIRPYAQLRAEATKARRGDRVYIPPTLADDLRKHRPDGAGDDAPVFPRVPTLTKWKSDLAAAGVPYMDAMGRQADFHGGTRKTLCSRMHRAGVPLAQAMRVMRHTDARLTMVDYADDDQIGFAVLPEVAPPAVPTAPTATATA